MSRGRGSTACCHSCLDSSRRVGRALRARRVGMTGPGRPFQSPRSRHRRAPTFDAPSNYSVSGIPLSAVSILVPVSPCPLAPSRLRRALANQPTGQPINFYCLSPALPLSWLPHLRHARNRITEEIAAPSLALGSCHDWGLLGDFRRLRSHILGQLCRCAGGREREVVVTGAGAAAAGRSAQESIG